MRPLRPVLPVLCVLTVGAATLAAALPAQAATKTGWRVNHKITLSGNSLMTGIAALGRNDAWALGVQEKPNDARVGLIERWNGKSWRSVPLPKGVRSTWNAAEPIPTIAVHSDTDLFAFSLFEPVYLRRSGTHWSTGTLPVGTGGSDALISVGVDRGPGDVWALGATEDSGMIVPYAARLDGTSWSVVPVPGHGPIVAASVLSAKDIWAVTGSRASEGSVITTKRPEVLHWNGTAWKAVKLPAKLPGLPSSIMAVSDHDVWIGGGHPNARHGTSEYVAQFTGKALHVSKLKVRATGSDFHMIRLVSDGHGGIWGVAANLTVTITRVWHRTGSAWHGPLNISFGHDSLLFSIAHVPGTTSMWGVGGAGRSAVIAVEGRVP
ncbi:MAG TPA: hypothetical protein VGI64_07480 [Streptosporangiaceae bacterium]|jgi:hypothetical protein